jgi:hypothetical protein
VGFAGISSLPRRVLIQSLQKGLAGLTLLLSIGIEQGSEGGEFVICLRRAQQAAYDAGQKAFGRQPGLLRKGVAGAPPLPQKGPG